MKLYDFNKEIIYIQKEFPNQPPEDDFGNKEYKWKLIPSYFKNVNEKLNKLASQMKYRLYEGNGRAIYLLGVTDTGVSLGLSEYDLYISINFIKNTAKIIKTKIDKIRLYNKGSNFIATIRLSNKDILNF